MDWKDFDRTSIDTKSSLNPTGGVIFWANIFTMIVIAGFSWLVLVFADRMVGVEYNWVDVLILSVIVRMYPMMLPVKQ